jgi:hypothetical protein
MGDGRFAGVDWASEEHAVCVVDEWGRILEGGATDTTRRGLCARLTGLRVELPSKHPNLHRASHHTCAETAGMIEKQHSFARPPATQQRRALACWPNEAADLCR